MELSVVLEYVIESFVVISRLRELKKVPEVVVKRKGVPTAKAEGGAEPTVKLVRLGLTPTKREDTEPVLVLVVSSVFWGTFNPPTPTKHMSWERVSWPKRQRRMSKLVVWVLSSH